MATEPTDLEEIEFSEEEVEPIVVEHHEFTDDEALLITGRPGRNQVISYPPEVILGTPPRESEDAAVPYAGVLDAPALDPSILTSRPEEPAGPEPGPQEESGYDQTVGYPAPPPEKDLESLADRLERAIRIAGRGPGSTRLALSLLEEQELTADDLRRLLGMLRDRGMLGEFLNHARRDEVWDYLRRRGVDWEFVFMNYAYGPRDSVDFFAGFVAGALANAGETLMLPLDIANALYVLTGSMFDEELAGRRDAFFGAVKQLLTSPIATGRLIGESWWNEFNGRLGRLQWFQAGAMLGKVVPDIVAAVKAAPAMAKGAASLVARLPALTKKLLSVRLSPRDLAELAKAIKSKVKNWVSSNGYRVEEVDGQRVLRAPDGRIEGRLEVTDQDLADWEREFDAWRQQAGDNPDVSKWVITDDVVDPLMAIDFGKLAIGVRRAVPRGSMSVQTWGTALHGKAADWLRAYFTSIGHADIDVLTDRAFSTFAGFDPSLARLSVGDFLNRFPEVRAMTSVPGDAKTLRRAIGDLEPDLIVVNRVTGQAIVADLAPAEARSHFRKTQLYAEILRKAVPGITQVKVGEYYYGALP